MISLSGKIPWFYTYTVPLGTDADAIASLNDIDMTSIVHARFGSSTKDTSLSLLTGSSIVISEIFPILLGFSILFFVPILDRRSKSPSVSFWLVDTTALADEKTIQIPSFTVSSFVPSAGCFSDAGNTLSVISMGSITSIDVTAFLRTPSTL